MSFSLNLFGNTEGAVISSKNQKNVVFNVDNYVECMFYHDNCTTYSYEPQNNNIEYLNWAIPFTLSMILR